MQLQILRNGSVNETFEIDEKTIFARSLMGEHKIISEFWVESPLDILLGDYIQYEGTQYTINLTPNVRKINNISYYYRIIFEAPEYNLNNKILLDEGANDFTYFGDASDFIQLLVDNINQIDSGWSLGTIDTTDEKYISFDNESCRSALNKIAQEFSLEYIVNAKEITLKKSIGVPTTLLFKYGRGNGLYELNRTALEDKNVITRVYGFGGTRNIDFNYRSGKKRIVFEDLYLEENTENYGVREASVTFDEIYPRRTGTITSIFADDMFSFVDSAIDFNLNDQLLEGLVAKVVFTTGALSGYEFEIISYNNSSKKVTIKEFNDTNDYKLPNNLNKPSVGDKYVFVDIKMPQSYIDAAESELETKTQEYLDENKNPRVAYELSIDEKYANDNGLSLNVGDKANVQDTPLGLSSSVRFASISFPLVNKYKIEATIADFIPYSIQEISYANGINNKKTIKRVDRQVYELARRNAALNNQIINDVFDAEGNYYTEKISPETIQTIAAQVGQPSQNFHLNGVVIEPNFEGGQNKIRISGGELIHLEYEIEGQGYIWQMTAYSNNSLQTSAKYYLYAKCSKTGLTGQWRLSQNQILVDDEPGYWNFGLGILYAANDGKRDFAFTNGMTYIHGDTIQTGRIKSIDGLNYFDLTQNKFNLGNAQSGIDWNVANLGKLTIRGGIVQNSGGIEGGITLYRGLYKGNTLYYTNDEVSHNGSTWVYVYPSPTQNNEPTENSPYWDQKVAKGDDGGGSDGEQGPVGPSGPFVVYRGVYNSGKIYYGTAGRIEVVKYSSIYYKTRMDAGSFQNVPPTDTAKWEPFGGTFESIATGILLAQLAYIDNLGVRHVRTSDSGKRVWIDGDQNSIRLYNTSGNLVLEINDEEDTLFSNRTPYIVVKNITKSLENRLSGNGLVVETGEIYKTGINTPELGNQDVVKSSILGRLTDDWDQINAKWAAIVGIDETYSGFGGYFNSLYTGAITVACRRVSGSFTCNYYDFFITCINSSNITIYLPQNPKKGRTLEFKRLGSGTPYLNGNGEDIYLNENPVTSTPIQGNRGDGARLVFDGYAWNYFKLNRY